LWKQTAVVPVFKKGNSISVKNYRPISILNIFSKIYEIIVHNDLSNFFKHSLNPAQHGFRKFSSTTTNLVTHLNSAMPSVCTQGKIDSAYFDLSSAFDIVPNNVLLHRLSNFGLSSSNVDWFHSYLDNRHSSIRISGMLSFSFVVKSGVPEGSTLGPLLLNIFINDICNSIQKSRYVFFSDDLKIYRNTINVDDCKLLQHDN
jgi:hypothetical protein